MGTITKDWSPLTMPRREEIEAVLLKHRSKAPCGHVKIDEYVIEALRALWTPPDREALNKLLLQWESRIIWNIDAKDGKSVYPERLDELMAWADPSSVPKVWCRHLTWNQPVGCFVYKDIEAVDDQWTVCPICGARRPTTPTGR